MGDASSALPFGPWLDDASPQVVPKSDRAAGLAEDDKERAGDQEGEQVRLVVVGRMDDRAADAPFQTRVRRVEVRRGPAGDSRCLDGDAGRIREPPTVAQALPRARTSIMVAIAGNGTLMTPVTARPPSRPDHSCRPGAMSVEE